jgi:hypothetical protein
MRKLVAAVGILVAVTANGRALANCYVEWQACKSDAFDEQNYCLSDCKGDFDCRRDCRSSLNSDLRSCSGKANVCLQSNAAPGPYPGPQMPGPYPGPQMPGPYPGPQMPGPYPGPQMPGPYPGTASPGPYPGPQMPGPYPGPQMPGPYPGPQMPGPYPGTPKTNVFGPCPAEAYEYKALRPGSPPIRVRKPNAPGNC